MGLLRAPAPQREVEGEDEDQELVGFRVRLGPAEGCSTPQSNGLAPDVGIKRSIQESRELAAEVVVGDNDEGWNGCANDGLFAAVFLLSRSLDQLNRAQASSSCKSLPDGGGLERTLGPLALYLGT